MSKENIQEQLDCLASWVQNCQVRIEMLESAALVREQELHIARTALNVLRKHVEEDCNTPLPPIKQSRHKPSPGPLMRRPTLAARWQKIKFA
jgi:hypothetical protein